jgi:chromosome segregation ATPase
MKHLLVLALLFTLAVGHALAADDPGPQYVDAFLLIQEGDAAKGKSDWKTAYTKFSAAQNILLGIKEKSPAWNAHLIQFRLEYCAEQIDAIKPNLAPSAPGLSATFVAPSKRIPDSAETQQLRTDLTEALKQIETLKRELHAAKKPVPTTSPSAAELDKLRAELAQARTDVERAKAAQLTAQADLNKKDAELAGRLAEMNQQIADLQKQLADRSTKIEDQNKLRKEIAKATAQADDLKKQNAQLTAQLATTRTEAERATQLATQVTALRQQLTEAQRLAAAGSGDLQKLRTELMETRAAADRSSQKQTAQLDQLKKENQTLALQLTDSKRANAGAANTSAELQTLRDELNTTRASSASQIESLQRERQALLARLATKDTRSPAANKGTLYTKPAAVAVVDEELQRQNRDLTGQLSTATRQLEKLRSQLAANTSRTRTLGDELSTLQDQNRDLARQLAGVKRADGNRGVLYRSTTAAPRTESTQRMEKENERLAGQLADARRQVTSLRQELTAKAKPAPVATGSEELEYQMRRLREENVLLRQLLNRYATHNPELKREAQGHAITLSPRKP